MSGAILFEIQLLDHQMPLLGVRRVAKNLMNVGSIAASRGAAALAELGFTALVARQLQLGDAGHFFVALTAMLLIANLCRSGLDYAVTRAVANHVALGREQNCSADILLAVLSAAFISTVLCGIAWILVSSPVGYSVFGGASNIFGVVIWSAIPLSLTYIVAEALKGLNKQILSQLSTGTITFFVASLLIAAVDARDASSLATIFLLASLGGFVTASGFVIVVVWSFGPLDWQSVSVKQFKTLLLQGLKLSPYRPLTLAANWMPIWLLNVMIGPTEAGVYAVANRLGIAISMIGIAVEALYAPRFARASLSDTKSLWMAREACLLSGFSTLPFGIALGFSSNWLLGILSPEYTNHAAVVLILLCAAYSSNAFLSPLGTFGAMTGKAKVLNLNAFMIATIVASLMYFVIPVFGAVGCAAVMIFVFILRGLSLYFFLRAD